jgi:hypothetical protein
MTKLPTAAKVGLLVAAIVTGLVVGWFVVIAPKRSETTKLQTKIDETRAQIAAAHAGLPPTRVPAIRVAELFKLSRAMPNTADVAGLLLQLSSVAAGTGVTFQSITPHDPVQFGGYQQIGIDLTFQGRFYDLSDFLYRLRNLVSVHDGVLDATGRLFSVSSIAFDQGELHFPQVKATLAVTAYVFGDGTAVPVPAGVASADGATPTTPATESSQPIPPVPPGATAAGA